MSCAASASSAPPIAPPATIGILGGGQLGRMLALAARAHGLPHRRPRPGPGLPGRVGRGPDRSSADYDDVGAALRLAVACAVVTYELEHVAAAVVDAIDAADPGPTRAACRSGDAGPARRAPVRRARRRRGRAVARGADRPTTCEPPPTSSACRSG